MSQNQREQLLGIATNRYTDALALLDQSLNPQLQTAMSLFRRQVQNGELTVTIDQFPPDMTQGRPASQQAIAFVDQFPGLQVPFSPDTPELHVVPQLTINIGRLLQGQSNQEQTAAVAAELIPTIMMVSQYGQGAERRWETIYREIFVAQRDFLQANHVPRNRILSDPRGHAEDDLLDALTGGMATRIDVGYDDFLRVVQIIEGREMARPRGQQDQRLLTYLQMAQDPYYFQALRTNCAYGLFQLQPSFGVRTTPEGKEQRAEQVAVQLARVGAGMYGETHP